MLVLVALAKYFGDKTGNCGYLWYISPNKIDSTIPFKQQRDVEELKITTAYIPLINLYIRNYLAVEMVPIRNDDIIGTKVCATFPCPIKPYNNSVHFHSFNIDNKIVADQAINIKEEPKLMILFMFKSAFHISTNT